MTTLSHERSRARGRSVLFAAGIAGLALLAAYAVIEYGPGWMDDAMNTVYHVLAQLANPYSYR